jgi:purine-binding chemotaxis protein CheW
MNAALLQNMGEAAGLSQYLTFRLAGEEYGIDILSVQEIKGWSSATPLPEAPSYVLGVINLRGCVVPIVDLRRRFGLHTADFGPTTVVIVARLEGPDSTRIAGFVVDAVCEVYSVSSAERRQVPEMGAATAEFVNGLATVEDKMIILLDVERLLAQAAAIDTTVLMNPAVGGVPAPSLTAGLARA